MLRGLVEENSRQLGADRPRVGAPVRRRELFGALATGDEGCGSLRAMSAEQPRGPRDLRPWCGGKPGGVPDHDECAAAGIAYAALRATADRLEMSRDGRHGATPIRSPCPAVPARSSRSPALAYIERTWRRRGLPGEDGAAGAGGARADARRGGQGSVPSHGRTGRDLSVLRAAIAPWSNAQLRSGVRRRRRRPRSSERVRCSLPEDSAPAQYAPRQQPVGDDEPPSGPSSSVRHRRYAELHSGPGAGDARSCCWRTRYEGMRGPWITKGYRGTE